MDMSKYNSVVERIFVYKLKSKYKDNKKFYLKQHRLNRKLIIKATKNTQVSIGEIYCGAGTVEIAAYNCATIKIGDRVCINSNCKIISRKEIIIGDDVMIGPNVIIYDHDHDYKSKNWKDDYISSSIKIGNNVWIAGGCTILRGVTIGDNCVIGAGVVLTKSVDSNSIVTSKNELIIRSK